MTLSYTEFLERKIRLATWSGFDVTDDEISCACITPAGIAWRAALEIALEVRGCQGAAQHYMPAVSRDIGIPGANQLLRRAW
jgi:hypothetical protein